MNKYESKLKEELPYIKRNLDHATELLEKEGLLKLHTELHFIMSEIDYLVDLYGESKRRK